MSENGLVSVAFTSHKAARAARERLVRAGFARNSIDIDRHGDEFEVSITTREENRARAERVLSRQVAGTRLREVGAQAVDAFNGQRTLALGLAVLAGFLLFGLVNRS